MAEDFKPGDQVRSKSGGPKMTVAKVADFLGETLVVCVWFDKQDKRINMNTGLVGFIEERFPPDALEKC